MHPFLQNPQSIAIKKYLFDILKERYNKNEKFIERLSSQTLTKEDYENLGILIADIFELGFLRAVDQYREQLLKMGVKINIIPEKKQEEVVGKSIFN